jgi:predicted naringenin-chalcone synthase
MTAVAVAGIGIAYPGVLDQDEMWTGFFARHYDGNRPGLARRIFEHSGVKRRHGVVNPLVEDVSAWSTEARMRRYLTEALPLGKDAVTIALGVAGLAPADIGLFVVCSCTGYATPGLDILLARDLGMAPTTQRLFIGHMGCYAALPGLSAATDYVTARGKPAVLLCLELTSLHLQPPSPDSQQIVAHALFSDAAAAVVLRPDSSSGPIVQEITAVTDTATADHMTWDVTDLGFRMGLSPKVPGVLSLYVADLVHNLLDRHDRTLADVAGWAVHPGGPKILDVVRDELDLPESALGPSRHTLAEHGNCSSPTVLLILDLLLRPAPKPGPVVMLAFGPGLTLYGALLT